MLGWFVFITLYVAVDAANDFARSSWLLSTFNPMSEWVEMLIGLSALTYIFLKRDQLRSLSPATGEAANLDLRPTDPQRRTT